MLTHLFRATLPGILFGMVALQPAYADIYTWTDASGRLTISNLTPPEGVRVTNILHESTPKIDKSNDTARRVVREAEVQALAERVRQLEDEVELARRQVPPQVDYRTAPSPPLVIYGGDTGPPQMQYSINVAPAASVGCDPSWMDCGLTWGPSIYPASVVVLSAPSFRRFDPIHPGRHVGPQRTLPGSRAIRMR